jgi:hypothetical protein
MTSPHSIGESSNYSAARGERRLQRREAGSARRHSGGQRYRGAGSPRRSRCGIAPDILWEDLVQSPHNRVRAPCTRRRGQIPRGFGFRSGAKLAILNWPPRTAYTAALTGRFVGQRPEPLSGGGFLLLLPDNCDFPLSLSSPTTPARKCRVETRTKIPNMRWLCHFARWNRIRLTPTNSPVMLPPDLNSGSGVARRARR